MRIYVAGPWVDRAIAVEGAKVLEAAGHTITHPWWKYEGESQENEPDDFLRDCAQHDVRGVRTADAVVVFNTSKSEGKAAEQGLAIAYGLPIVCITPGARPTTNIFHYLPNYTHVTTIEEAVEALSE